MFSHAKLESKKKHILNSKAVVVLCVTGGLRRGRIEGGGSFRRSESEGMEMTDGVMSRLPVLSDAGGRYRKGNRWRSESMIRGGADPVYGIRLIVNGIVSNPQAFVSIN
ncbi:hypothetical protein RYX36_032981 [Vicia faba]